MMRFPLWLLLFIFVAAMVAAAEINIVSTGDGDAPLTKMPHVDLNLKDGKAAFQIDTTQARAIQFQFGTFNGFPKLSCASKENRDESQLKSIAAGRWYRIDSVTACSLEAAANTEIQLFVLNQPAVKITTLAPGPTWAIKDTPKALRANSISTFLTFRSASFVAAADPPLTPLSSKLDGISTRLDSFSRYSLVLPFLLMVLIIGATAYQGLLLNRTARQERQNIDTKIVPRLELFSAKAAKLASQDDVNGLRNLSEELKFLIGGLSREETMDRGHRNETMSGAQAIALQTASGESGSKFEQRSATQPASAQEPLPQILRTLAQSYFSDGGRGTDAVVQLEQKISEFLRQPPPATDMLQESHKKMASFASALEGVLDTIGHHEWHVMIQRFLNEARELQAEIEDLQQPAANSMRLHFNIEFYTSAANRASLLDGIGAGLKKQIVKLDQPVKYFDRQFRVLSTETIEKTAEFLDAKVDKQRCNPQVQAILHDLLSAGELEQILPIPRQAFHSAEHKVVKVEPRPAGATEGPSIAQVVARGFRRGHEIVRPASVVVYE